MNNYNDLKIAVSTLYYPLTIHGKYNSKWGNAIDCGIHKGQHSLVYSTLFNNVTSIDAIITPEAEKSLAQCDNVNVMKQCLFSCTGNSMTFYEPEESEALSTLYKSFLYHNIDDPKNITEHKVTTSMLDDIINTPVDFLKTDLEGADDAALLGATELISKNRPTIVTDLHNHLIEKFLNNLDYEKYIHTERWCKDAIYFPRELKCQ